MNNTITLPIPPSANNLWKPLGKGLAKTSSYKSWLALCSVKLLQIRPDRMPQATPLAVTIIVATSRRRDVDNVIKPSIDMLESCGVIPDDRWVDKVTAKRATLDTRLANNTIQIHVEPIHSPQ